jgi:hypothetical protein
VARGIDPPFLLPLPGFVCPFAAAVDREEPKALASHLHVRGRFRRVLGSAGLVGVILAALIAAAPAAAQVNGAAFTTVNPAVDGPDRCMNGPGTINCNLYTGKQYVWLNGGPVANKIGPDGYYFFAVLVPSGQPNPNDRVPLVNGDTNLSDDYDTYQNRTFRVLNGEVHSYAGTHDFDPVNDPANPKIRLMPYSNTTNNGGVYILAICSLGANGTSYPVTARQCKYDAFKIPGPDTDPPECPSPTFSIVDGKKTATQRFRDAGGIRLIDVVSITNATWSISPEYYLGSVDWVTLIATKIDQTVSATVRIVVTDIAGNQTECDPVYTTLRSRGHSRGRAGAPSVVQRFTGLTENEDMVRIRNAWRGLSRIDVVVNGKRFSARGLRGGERRRIAIGAALRADKPNTVVLRGWGRRGASANVIISN